MAPTEGRVAQPEWWWSCRRYTSGKYRRLSPTDYHCGLLQGNCCSSVVVQSACCCQLCVVHLSVCHCFLSRSKVHWSEGRREKAEESSEESPSAWPKGSTEFM